MSAEYVAPHPAIPDLDITAADCDPSALLDEPDARNRVDPWDVWPCPSCGEVTPEQPETCPSCNWRNYGRAS